MSGKMLVNDPKNSVPEAIEGLLLCNSDLAQIAGLNIVCRKDIAVYKQVHVTLISGGGSGHEPAHAGFVGDGMLTAAVCGNVFASPSVSMILAAIRTCAGPPGCLLIVKNYTGDRLNFGMAMEKAKAEGFAVSMVIVADDCALPEGKGITGGRGVAGTIFVHKVAGASAASGLTLEEVTKAAREASAAIGSMGVALTTCTIPGAPASTRLDENNKYEVGLGIHGEPGREVRYFPTEGKNNADTVADILVEAVCERMSIGQYGVVGAISTFFVPPAPVAVMLNNLGTLPSIEMSIVARKVVRALAARNLHSARVYVGAFMTSLDMCGVSLTLFRASPAQLDLLDAPTKAPAWVPATKLAAAPAVCELPYEAETFNKRISGGPAAPGAARIVEAIARRIVSAEPELTRCDAICGDGDCGIVMRAGAEALLGLVASKTLVQAENDAARFCDEIASTISASMGGTSGALLELCFRAMANVFAAGGDGATWPAALQAGLHAIEFYGGASVGMRTMLDALVPAVKALCSGGDAAAAAEEAKQGAESTKNMGGLAGRSNYIKSQDMAGVPDPGALAVSMAFAAAAEILAGPSK